MTPTLRNRVVQDLAEFLPCDAERRERLRQIPVRRVAFPTLDVTDIGSMDARSLGEGLLRKALSNAELPEHEA